MSMKPEVRERIRAEMRPDRGVACHRRVPSRVRRAARDLAAKVRLLGASVGPGTGAPAAASAGVRRRRSRATVGADPGRDRGGVRARRSSGDPSRLNYLLGFIPGYNLVRFAGGYAGVQFNFTQALAGYGSFVSPPNVVDSLAAVTSGGSAIARGNFAAAGGEAGLARAAELVGRNSFSARSTAKQAKLLANVGRLSRLGRLASGLGTAANLFNTGAAIYDALQCRGK